MSAPNASKGMKKVRERRNEAWSIEQMKKEDRGSKDACVQNIGDSWRKPLSLW